MNTGGRRNEGEREERAVKCEEYRRIDDNNRILIPKWLREAMDLGPGDLLRISLQDNLRTEAEMEK